MCVQVEQFWRFYSHLIRPGDLSGHSDFHLFKEGIKPMWEVFSVPAPLQYGTISSQPACVTDTHTHTHLWRTLVNVLLPPPPPKCQSETDCSHLSPGAGSPAPSGFSRQSVGVCYSVRICLTLTSHPVRMSPTAAGGSGSSACGKAWPVGSGKTSSWPCWENSSWWGRRSVALLSPYASRYP